MPSQTEHLAQARRNLEILEQFSFTTCACLDWLVVLAFYTALHWVDAFLATLGRHPKNHFERNRDVSNYLRDIYAHYTHLYNVSREVRYFAIPYPRRRARYANALRNEFAAIRTHFGY